MNRGDCAETLFDPNGLFCRVNQESVLLVGGPAALLMQIAHPKIAEAVSDHSEFPERPVSRLYNTVTAMQTVIFGNRTEALAMVRRINAMHADIKGVLKTSTRSFPAGDGYSGDSPDLLMWVYATLIHTMIETYGEFFQALTDLERESFYRDSRVLALLLGIPESTLPPTYPAFRHYFDGMLNGSVLELTPTARFLAERVLEAAPGIPTGLVRLAGIALLPHTLRLRYGFDWHATDSLTWHLATTGIQGLLRLTSDTRPQPVYGA